MRVMEIQTMTKKELEDKQNELEKQFNVIRDELSDYIKSTEAVIKEKTERMGKLSTEYSEIKTELDKRDGKTNR